VSYSISQVWIGLGAGGGTGCFGFEIKMGGYSKVHECENLNSADI